MRCERCHGDGFLEDEDGWEECPECLARGKCGGCGGENVAQEADHAACQYTFRCYDCGWEAA